LWRGHHRLGRAHHQDRGSHAVPGERLFLVAEARTYQGFILAPVALVLDDLRIQ
jgi:hypothetical protein